MVLAGSFVAGNKQHQMADLCKLSVDGFARSHSFGFSRGSSGK